MNDAYLGPVKSTAQFGAARPVNYGYPQYAGYAGYGGYGSYYAPPAVSRSVERRGETWSEYIPVEQRYTDYVAEQKIEYKPVERTYTDYIEVQHQTDYVPVPRLEKRVEYIPVEKYDEHVDYVPVERSQVVKAPATLNTSRSYAQIDAPMRRSYVEPAPAYGGYATSSYSGYPYTRSYAGYAGYGGYGGGYRSYAAPVQYGRSYSPYRYRY